MGVHPRPKPKRLAAKLLAVREGLGISQPKMAKMLGLKMKDARVSEYEHGIREPNLMVVLAYSRAACIPVEFLIDDDLDLNDAYES